jgi:23S rRNA pseudouridine955/2504/2580 synthase
LAAGSGGFDKCRGAGPALLYSRLFGQDRDTMAAKGDTAQGAGSFNAVQQLVVGEPNADQRLDNFLLGRLKGVPKTLIYRIIRKGEVRVNGKRAKPEQRVVQGDVVRVPPLRLAEQGAPALPGAQLQQHLRAAILHEDEQLLVLNKPAGLAVHAGTGMKLGVIEALRAMYPEVAGLELVHRLDKGTSGCLLLAKTGKARKALTDAFREQHVHKVYHLIVAGQWPQKLTRVELALQRQEERGGDQGGGERRVEVDPEGKAARTDFRVLQRLGTAATLVEARPSTGRTHQIRVHATAQGFPLLGDDKYSTPQSERLGKQRGVHRLCLHAAALEFRHPVSGQLLRVEAPYDEAFTRVLKQLAAAD